MQTAQEHPAFEVRDAVVDDAPALARIYTEAVESGRCTMDTEALPPRVFRDRLCAPRERQAILVGSDPRGVVAWGQVRPYSERPGYAAACESSTYVTGSATGRGVGSLLLPLLLERARGLGYHHIVAKVLAVNGDSVRFHHRFGFETVGRQREIGRLRGTWHDVVILQCVLSERTPS